LSAGAVGGLAPISSAPVLAEGETPLVLNIAVVMAERLRIIDTNTLKLDATANLRVLGTFSRPALTGNIQIDGGQAMAFGNRYYIRESLIEFTNPDRLDPVFDIAAETRPRVAGQTFNINIRVTGTAGHFTPTITSDPWLPESDIYTLLVGGTADLQTAEQRSLRSSQELQQKMIVSVAGAVFTSQVTSKVGQVLEKTGAVDAVQITPLLTAETTLQQTSATARVTLGRRISNRVFLTYSRTLSGPQDEIIVLEYDQNDRLSWVLSRNEDRSFALDFRVRYVF
jgi:translocation and assembly module TamB